MATPAALRVFEVHARTYRRTYRGSIITTFVNPVLYLAAMGLGLGTLVDEGTGAAAIGGVSYLAFLAPGLLAATAMQIGGGEGAYKVMAGMKWLKTYHAALTTPISARDLVVGHLGWSTVRIALTTVVFGAVMVGFDAATPGAAVRAQLPAILTGIVFATAVTAYTAQLENEYGLAAIFRFGIVPMFLFSGTFFPITQLPGWMQPIAYLTPLWHGVELTRGAALSEATAWQPSLHMSYLALWIAVSSIISVRNFRKRLIK